VGSFIVIGIPSRVRVCQRAEIYTGYFTCKLIIRSAASSAPLDSGMTMQVSPEVLMFHTFFPADAGIAPALDPLLCLRLKPESPRLLHAEGKALHSAVCLLKITFIHNFSVQRALQLSCIILRQIMILIDEKDRCLNFLSSPGIGRQDDLHP